MANVENFCRINFTTPNLLETKEVALSKRVEMRISKEGLADSFDDLSEGDEGRITLVSGI